VKLSIAFGGEGGEQRSFLPTPLTRPLFLQQEIASQLPGNAFSDISWQIDGAETIFFREQFLDWSNDAECGTECVLIPVIALSPL